MNEPTVPLVCVHCRMNMQRMVRDGVMVHHCYGCGSHWFDGGGLARVMSKKGLKFQDEGLDDRLQFPQGCRFCEELNPPGSESCKECGRPLWYQCPVDGSTLYIIFEEGIELDFCPTCRGLWFDQKELKELEERLAVRASGSYRAQGVPAATAMRCEVCGEPDPGGGVTDIRGLFRCGPCMRDYLAPDGEHGQAIREDYLEHWRGTMATERGVAQAVSRSARSLDPHRGGLISSLLGSLLR